MTPLPFSLPAALEIGELYASPDVMLVQVYDRYLVAAARAACILSREHHPERPVIVLAELEGEAASEFADTARRAADAVELCLDEGVIPARNKLNARPHQAEASNEPQVDTSVSPKEA